MILDKYPGNEKDKKLETEEFKESPASDVRVEESAKAGRKRGNADQLRVK